ncbi:MULTISPECIES: monovalent cation/H+ antiporter complex subunit F [unclassified Fusibacter]|uniref:monovalent cation/H+ antiporter complex subunit F n=1 Tax=unclassified Fusibacter TaxID=2624464 RepID=UPI0010108198|nr:MULTISPECIES: monovalent cation/H+ antiporter complex subunit F [unclassified Fusibacter]MCK8059656.1 monovalent cation/H+ antiporter complex subunit F [Fusibacter sp. A2]NPE21457.1 pH regulation protein F [Fusibacter sp. A1]RXV61868.1 pH regulation protein F [Fusibacter sp. A1]
MTIILIVLVLMAVLSAVRIMIGPTMWDRLLGLNMVSSKLIMAIVVLASMKKEAMILDIALLYGLLGFVGVTFMAIFIQKRGRY